MASWITIASENVRDWFFGSLQLLFLSLNLVVIEIYFFPPD